MGSSVAEDERRMLADLIKEKPRAVTVWLNLNTTKMRQVTTMAAWFGAHKAPVCAGFLSTNSFELGCC